MRSLRQKDILNGNIFKQLMLLVFPLFLGYLVQNVYSAVDSMILGKFVSTNALAAVGGSAYTIISIAGNFMNGIGAAVTVNVAQNYGRGDGEGVSNTIKSGLLLAISFGLLLAIPVILFTKTILTLLDTPSDIMMESTLYLRMYMISFVPYFLYNVGVSVFRATGDSKRPLYFMILICGLKIGLDLLFAAVLKWGVFGTSLATMISFTTSALVVIYISCFKMVRGMSFR